MKCRCFCRLKKRSMSTIIRSELKGVYRTLFSCYGPQGWWPADSVFEVIVGAILTQNTAWGNVEKAILNLKGAGIMEPDAMRKVRLGKLARLIRPSGYYNLKARKLKSFMEFFYREYGGDLKLMKRERIETLRPKLLSVWGLGPETVDSILLYALGKPSFVVDAYTKRLFNRLGFLDGSEDYGEVKKIFEDNLGRNAKLYKEYHALIVEHCKRFCLKNKPDCRGCDVSHSCMKP